MDHQPDTGNIRIEHAFNETTQLAIGEGAQVHITADAAWRQDPSSRPLAGSTRVGKVFSMLQTHLTPLVSRRILEIWTRSVPRCSKAPISPCCWSVPMTWPRR